MLLSSDQAFDNNWAQKQVLQCILQNNCPNCAGEWGIHKGKNRKGVINVGQRKMPVVPLVSPVAINLKDLRFKTLFQ